MVSHEPWFRVAVGDTTWACISNSGQVETRCPFSFLTLKANPKGPSDSVPSPISSVGSPPKNVPGPQRVSIILLVTGMWEAQLLLDSPLRLLSYWTLVTFWQEDRFSGNKQSLNWLCQSRPEVRVLMFVQSELRENTVCLEVPNLFKGEPTGGCLSNRHFCRFNQGVSPTLRCFVIVLAGSIGRE